LRNSPNAAGYDAKAVMSPERTRDSKNATGTQRDEARWLGAGAKDVCLQRRISNPLECRAAEFLPLSGPGDAPGAEPRVKRKYDWDCAI